MNDRVEPPITDDSGYCIRERDLRFLGIGSDDVVRWRTQTTPLGLSEIHYQGLVKGLREALSRDYIDPAGCDIRLKGSAAAFFAGLHKQLPQDRDAVIDLFTDMRERYPDEWEVDEIMDRLHGQWVRDGAFPRRRPFDSLFRIGVERDPSDIDLKLSDDRLVERCEHRLVASGQSPTEARLEHPIYSFIKKALIQTELPNLWAFGLRASDALRRHVSIAIFPSSGPPDVTATHGALSAHHRADDWHVK